MITTVMAKSKNLMPDDEINEQIAALGPGWKVVSVAINQVPWGEWVPPANENDVTAAKHLYIAVVVVLEKPDEPEPVTETQL